MISRYTLPEMAEIWSQERKFKTWLEVELAVIDSLAHYGLVPKDVAGEIRSRASFSVRRINEIEVSIRHDVLAFVECVSESLGDLSRYFHMGLTSSDVVDTALALLLKQASQVILAEMRDIETIVKDLAREHEKTLIVGRTHGMHAEPTSLGLKFAVWYNALRRSSARFQQASREVSVGKMSGSVGSYAHLDPKIELDATRRLGLEYERPATQIVQRDRHASFILTCSLIASVIENIAVEIRNLQRTEIGEMEEPFGQYQKGSSSMPHKRNPITLERICGLARLLRGYAICALENVALWHERDISHSSVERIIMPHTTSLLHYMIRSMKDILKGLRINTGRMLANLEMTKGLIFSQRLMLELMRGGWTRKKAYEKVQELSKAAVEQDRNLRDLSLSDSQVRQTIGESAIEKIFDPSYYLRHVHKVFLEIGIVQESP